MSYEKSIVEAIDLVTSEYETKAGFIRFALEKSKRCAPYIEQAKVLRCQASKAKDVFDLIHDKTIRAGLLTAAGLSDKSLKYLGDEDKEKAINQLVKNFLEPAGENFVDELVYRYLLIKGDAMGGSMRNIIGIMAEKRLFGKLLAVLSARGMYYRWKRKGSKAWEMKPEDETILEGNCKIIAWSQEDASFELHMNENMPLLKKNVDICLYRLTSNERGLNASDEESSIIMLGELKGGIDPAGADEHWKTANSALRRIRQFYEGTHPNIKTSFLGAAIEKSMAEEMFLQLKSGELSYAANLSNDEQLTNYCQWIVEGCANENV